MGAVGGYLRSLEDDILVEIGKAFIELYYHTLKLLDYGPDKCDHRNLVVMLCLDFTGHLYAEYTKMVFIGLMSALVKYLGESKSYLTVGTII